MTLNDVMGVISLNLVNTCVPTHNRVDIWRNLCTSLLYFVVRARCRRKESSRSLSHLLMSFLLVYDQERMRAQPEYQMSLAQILFWQRRKKWGQLLGND